VSLEKIKSSAQLRRIALRLRKQRKRLVFTNGCFDVLHYGHVKYLQRARRLGDFLIVGLNSDRSVRQLKGKGRPIFPVHDRAGILAGLACVDYISVFNESTPLSLINQVKPDILVKGGDWASKDIVGAAEVKAWGGVVRRITLLKGRSTTNILRRFDKRRRK